MTPVNEKIVHDAKEIYEQRYKKALESKHLNAFCAIEPISGDYFIGRTLSEAIGAARIAYPDRISHTVRVGHSAAVHIGVLSTQMESSRHEWDR